MMRSGGRCPPQWQGPAFVNLPPERVELEAVGVAQPLADAECAAQRAAAEVDARRLCEVGQPQQERGDDHAGGGGDAADGVPLQLGDAVAHARDAAAQHPRSEEVGQSGHEAAVERDHQLDDVVGGAAGRGEREHLVVGQAVEVPFRQCEGDRVAQRAGGGDVVDDLARGDAAEVVVAALELLLGGDGQPLQVVERADVARVDALAAEHLPVEARVLLEVAERLAEALLLEGANRLGRCELDSVVAYHGHLSLRSIS